VARRISTVASSASRAYAAVLTMTPGLPTGVLPGSASAGWVSWAQAGDFEGGLTYGIGIAWPNPLSNPQFAVRAVEVGKATAQGQHRYVVAIDIDATG
jgi:hypothetical protein